MMNLVGGSIAVGFGLLLLKMSFDEARDVIEQVDDLKNSGKIRKGEWAKTTGTVLKTGMNVDYPEVLKSWPKRESFSSEEEYNHALRKAKDEVHECALMRGIYGDILIQYQFTDHNGATITTRTIGLLPDPEKDRKLVMGLSPGSQVTVYYPKSDPRRAILRKTTDEEFKRFFNGLLGPTIGKLSAGALIFTLGIISFIPGVF